MRILSFVLFLVFTVSQGEGQMVFHNAEKFTLLGKVSGCTETTFERLPAYLKNVCRPELWERGKSTAGLAIRFCTNSPDIALKWDLYQDNVVNHMAFTGIKGLDLYTLEGNNWTFVNTARPAGKKNEFKIISSMEKKKREFLLFLPLYDGINSLEIGIDSASFISNPEIDLPVRNNPIICYGTSILQGGCASRPGMAYTNILTRWLNREVINLGFSANGRLDYEIAELISRRAASVIILDFMPNVGIHEIEERTEKFYRIIRDKQPDVPILFIENPEYPRSKFNLNEQRSIREKNEALNKVLNHLKQSGEKDIELISSSGMIGYDNEATVDGAHFTDLGFMRYAEFSLSYITKYLH